MMLVMLKTEKLSEVSTRGGYAVFSSARQHKFSTLFICLHYVSMYPTVGVLVHENIIYARCKCFESAASQYSRT